MKRILRFFICIFSSLMLFSIKTFAQDTLLINQSIDKAINYLNHRIKNQQLYFYIVPILKPIALYYNLPLDSSINIKSKYTAKEKYLIELLSPLYTERELKPSDKKNIDSLSAIDRLIMYSLYGNKLYNKSYFKTYMDSLISWGQYDLSHAYLIALLQKNKSFISKSKVNYYLNKTHPLVIKMLPDLTEHFSDLEIEVIALLLYANYDLNPQYISQLISQQTPEGSWKEKPDEINDWMNDHTTVLALWALLEWKYKSDTFLFLAHPKFVEKNSKKN